MRMTTKPPSSVHILIVPSESPALPASSWQQQVALHVKQQGSTFAAVISIPDMHEQPQPLQHYDPAVRIKSLHDPNCTCVNMWSVRVCVCVCVCVCVSVLPSEDSISSISIIPTLQCNSSKKRLHISPVQPTDHAIWLKLCGRVEPCRLHYVPFPRRESRDRNNIGWFSLLDRVTFKRWCLLNQRYAAEYRLC